MFWCNSLRNINSWNWTAIAAEIYSWSGPWDALKCESLKRDFGNKACICWMTTFALCLDDLQFVNKPFTLPEMPFDASQCSAAGSQKKSNLAAVAALAWTLWIAALCGLVAGFYVKPAAAHPHPLTRTHTCIRFLLPASCPDYVGISIFFFCPGTRCVCVILPAAAFSLRFVPGYSSVGHDLKWLLDQSNVPIVFGVRPIKAFWIAVSVYLLEVNV